MKSLPPEYVQHFGRLKPSASLLVKDANEVGIHIPVAFMEHNLALQQTYESRLGPRLRHSGVHEARSLKQKLETALAFVVKDPRALSLGHVYQQLQLRDVLQELNPMQWSGAMRQTTHLNLEAGRPVMRTLLAPQPSATVFQKHEPVIEIKSLIPMQPGRRETHGINPFFYIQAGVHEKASAQPTLQKDRVTTQMVNNALQQKARFMWPQ
jgi:hypothetical protein